MPKPFAILGTHVICADSDEEAEHLAKTVDLNIVRRAKGEYLPLASPEDAAAYDYTPVDKARIAQNRARMSVGAPATVKVRLDPLIAATQADELMVTTMIFDHARASILMSCWPRLLRNARKSRAPEGSAIFDTVRSHAKIAPGDGVFRVSRV